MFRSAIEIGNKIHTAIEKWQPSLLLQVQSRTSQEVIDYCKRDFSEVTSRGRIFSLFKNHSTLINTSLLSLQHPADSISYPGPNIVPLTKTYVRSETGPAINPDLRGLSMKGKIRTKEKCPVCSKCYSPTLHPKSKDVIMLSCDTCKTSPQYYYIDARDILCGRIYSDQHGKKFDSFEAGYRQLQAMRHDIDEKKFDPSHWVPSMKRVFSIEEMSKKWLALVEAQDYEHFRHCRTAMELHVKPVLTDLKVVDVRDIRTVHVDAVYLLLKSKKYEPKTIKNYMQHFHQFCNYLYGRDFIDKMPKFPSITVPEKFKPWIPKETQLLILSKVVDEYDNMILVETFLQGGHRPSELIAHQPMDLQDGELVVSRAFDCKGNIKCTKTGLIARRQISTNLYTRLLKHCVNKKPDDYIFLRDGNRPYSYDAFYHLWSNAAMPAGIKIAPVAGARRSKVSQERERLEREMKEVLRGILDHESDAWKDYARGSTEKI
jgi:hypothetical protein